ncbi:protocatechuate 3,4-dioxygenase subunit beta [Ferrimicrobium sp.]|uniref:protocatechuate 3,4-dioxygenase subunit beta n=1 Tax=Ferrimicrobium sp. TaxID=2926050 RepID=UPI00344D5DA3
MKFSIDPSNDTDEYRSSVLRAPKQPLIVVPERLLNTTMPIFDSSLVKESDSDILHQHNGEPLGERIRVTGRLLNSEGRGLGGQLIELWQANAAGRYRHAVDDHQAPLDPNFTGAGRALTGDDGTFSFLTIKPGAYPWKNAPNAWRPAHIHFSIFGRAFTERLITQMYFPGDPLLAFDPIFNSVRQERVRNRLVANFDWEATQEEYALGYRFDIVINGHLGIPLEGQ